jgi:hypothetical protein
MVSWPLCSDFEIETPGKFFNLRPTLLAVLHKQVSVESYAAVNGFSNTGAMGKSDLSGNIRKSRLSRKNDHLPDMESLCIQLFSPSPSCTQFTCI